MLTYDTNTPVLLLIFNRPDTAAVVFERIRMARPKRLYIAADGPRNDQEAVRCEETRKLVEQVDWDCQVKTLFRMENLGCKRAMSSGITWFFEQEAEGIVLEDDCVPDPSFFGFCSHMLAHYRTDDRIGHIGGSNLQLGQKRGPYSYYFSRMTHAWGWAGWRRVWESYDVDMKTFPDFQRLDVLKNIPSHAPFSASWYAVFQENYAGKVDSWAYPYTYHNLVNNRLSVIPNQNLIRNIGFRADSTHTADSGHVYANLDTTPLHSIEHPPIIVADVEADIFTQVQEGHPRNAKPKGFLSRSWKKIKQGLKGA